jgi:hypothetical protein
VQSPKSNTKRKEEQPGVLSGTVLI